MKSTLFGSALAALLVSTGAVLAAESSTILKVNGMYCASCPYIVKKSLTRIEGVTKVSVSLKQGEARITFDDAKTDPAELAAAVTDSGFPSRPVAPE